MTHEARALYVERDGVRLHVVEEGNRKGPLVVFVHGYPDDLRVWDGVVAQLKDEFHILRYDVRGAGLSDTPQAVQEYRLQELSEDLVAVVDEVAPDKAFHVVGHDWGSIQLWESVTDSSLRGRIRSFVSASGPSIDFVSMQNRAAWQSREPRKILRSLNQAVRSWYVMMFQLPVLPELAWTRRGTKMFEKRAAAVEKVPFAVFHDENRARNGRSGIALYRANMLQRMGAPEPRRSDVPTKVLVVSGDPYVSETIAYSCKDWMSEVEFQVVPGGHWFYLVQPELFAEPVRAFVRAHAE